MAKKESTFLNMVLTLLIITAVAALALGGVYTVTKGPIALARQMKALKAIQNVLPEYSKLDTSYYVPQGSDDTIWIFNAYDESGKVGAAVRSYSNKGYDPTQIQVMVGFQPDGQIINSEVLQQKETPGLGTKMELPEFRDQFKGKNPASSVLKVKNDGGVIDAITAATISSRAYCDAVERAYKSYENSEGGNK